MLLSDMLKGSGLRYNELVPAIVTRVSPRILLEAVDSFDFDLIATAASINIERASKLLVHLRAIDLSQLATLDIEDEVSLQLLDGTDYKDLSELSTGQRCTVVLPLVLAHQDRVLVVDQPEDHIDNAFIANTLIKAILARRPTSQIFFDA